MRVLLTSINHYSITIRFKLHSCFVFGKYDFLIGLLVMDKDDKNPDIKIKSSKKEGKYSIELHRVPIEWDLNKGNLSFFKIDSALFWTNPSMIHMLAPIAEELGNDLFRLLVAYSSSLGTEEDYNNMISILGNSFEEGFLAWGKAVSTAGWGTFEISEYKPDDKQATVIVNNPWEINMQRTYPAEKRWGSPFLQGKIIGIFNHAFDASCWADDICDYDSDNPHTKLSIYPSRKTIKFELNKLRYEQMMEREKVLADEVNQKTIDLQKAKEKIELYSIELEQQVAERTEELVKTNKRLQDEIESRKEAESKKEKLILDLQNTLNEIKTLKGLLPICASCKKIRDDKGYWNQIESYIRNHSEAEFTHSICPECSKKLYSDLDIGDD